MADLAADGLHVLAPTRADYQLAADILGRHALGLRAGDALHLAVAMATGAECFYTLDRKLM